ncbi:MAG: hypothetical protein IKO47_09950 [Ruminococcus sp.]|nr:hypothetical protein [Ruminococcus sp.]
MYYLLAALMDSAPVTGDDFPKEKLFTVIGIAVAVIVAISILSFVLSKKQDDSDKDDKQDKDQ